MSQPGSSNSRHLRERLCPQCGTRVAQRARTCFSCGQSLDSAPARRRVIPWADLALFGVIAALLAFWWTRAPLAPDDVQIALGGERASASAELMMADVTPESSPTLSAATETPIPTATPEPSPTSAPAPVHYKVQPGDTVELIAGMHGSTIQDIIAANSLGPDARISVDQELIIPVAGAVASIQPTATPANSTLVYAVQAGDTVATIASKFGSQVDWILTANNMQATDLLQVSQSLLVPTSNATSTPEAAPVPATAEPISAEAQAQELRPPALLLPADGAELSDDDEPMLSWASVGVLAEDQWYVVTLSVTDELDFLAPPKGTNPPAMTPIAPFWTKGTTWRLPVDYHIASEHGTVFVWQVQVLRGNPTGAASPEGAPSDKRHFTWK